MQINGPSGLHIWPKPTAGAYYDISWTLGGSGFGDQTLATGFIFYVPFYLPVAASFDQLAIYVSVAAAASSKARMGLYDANPSTLMPRTRLVDAGEVAIDSLGTKTATVSLSLAGDRWYWTAVESSASGASVKGFSSGAPAPVGRTDLSGPPRWGFSESFVYAALPATANPSSTQGGALRVVSLRAA